MLRHLYSFARASPISNMSQLAVASLGDSLRVFQIPSGMRRSQMYTSPGKQFCNTADFEPEVVECVSSIFFGWCLPCQRLLRRKESRLRTTLRKNTSDA